MKGVPGNELHRPGRGLRARSPISKTLQMIRMVQRGCGGGFAAQASRAAVGFAARCAGQNLDGYLAAEFGVPGAVDLAHAAGGKGREDLVGAEFSAASRVPWDGGVIASFYVTERAIAVLFGFRP